MNDYSKRRKPNIHLEAFNALGSSLIKNLPKKPLTVGSLFAGIGGFDLAFKKEGFEIKWANEIDTKACISYKANFPNTPLFECDIKNLVSSKLQEVDVLTAGFPCQTFSIAGHRKGFKDERGSVFFEIFKVIEKCKPKVLLLENVKNLYTHNNGKTFKEIITKLENEGYLNTTFKILNTYQYSEIPQNRERVFIVAFKNKKEMEGFKFPEPVKKTKLIREFLEDKVDEGFYYEKFEIHKHLKQCIKNKETLYQWRRQYVRENKKELCPTLTANMGTGGHNVPLVICNTGRIRKLTPRECANFQGYQKSFKLPKNLNTSALYKQIGNSVSIPVIGKLARNIKLALI